MARLSPSFFTGVTFLMSFNWNSSWHRLSMSAIPAAGRSGPEWSRAGPGTEPIGRAGAAGLAASDSLDRLSRIPRNRLSPIGGIALLDSEMAPVGYVAGSGRPVRAERRGSCPSDGNEATVNLPDYMPANTMRGRLVT